MECEEYNRRGTEDHNVMNCMMLGFPFEILIHIIDFMDGETILRSMTMCKFWHSFVKQQETSIWKRLCLRLWPSLTETLYKSQAKASTIKHLYKFRDAWTKAAASMEIQPPTGRGSTKWQIEGGTRVMMIETSEGLNVKTASPWKPLVTFPTKAVYYYELHIEHAGNARLFGVGLCDACTPHVTLPGWNRGGNTIGYHADNGLKYWKMGSGDPYAEPYKAGDIVGCGYDVLSASVFFTKNGVFLGTAFSGVDATQFYPMVGSLEPINVTFIFGPVGAFKFDIDAFYTTYTFQKQSSRK